MRQDLERFFNVKGAIVKKRIQCLVLSEMQGEDKIRSKGSTEETNFLSFTDLNTRFCKSFPAKPILDMFRYLLKCNALDLPLVSILSPTEKIDISIDRNAWDNMDLEQLKKEFRKFNLDLSVKYALTDVLVLTENKDK